MVCLSCGTENRPGRKFCAWCAIPLIVVCPTCQSPNEPAELFCGECATPLAIPPTNPVAIAPPHVAERRLVTVLFADLVGFTPFAEERDPEEVRETLSRYFELASDVIGRYGGTVEKFIGDAVMAVWGAPVAHEDDAERAVRAALELLEVIPSLGPEIRARAGVLTGEAAVTLGASGQGMVAGDLVNSASRLQSAAPPGTVLVGEGTLRAASRAISFEAAGQQVLKGKAGSSPTWRAVRVVAERRGRNRSEALEPPFVGRSEELRALKDALHATGRDRRARLVSITGPAGIGKSRLVWELRKYVDGLVEPVYWHEGRSPAYGDGVTFWALGEMVRGRAGLAETDDESTTRARVDDLLAEWAPGDEDRRWIEPALLALLGVGQPPPGGRDVLVAGWRMLFEAIAARGTTVLVFEDLQWADTGLLDFIEHLLAWGRDVPILVVTLARPELFDRRAAWGVGTRSVTALALEPLDGTAMRRLLLGLVPGLPDRAVTTIVDRAGGIPLYAVETIRMLVVEGRLEPVDGVYLPVGELDELAVPETLRSLVAARLDALDPADRGLLEDAAVLGGSFTLDALAAVSGLPGEAAEPRLQRLVRRELLTVETDPRSPERGQYAFVQVLVREVAYSTLARRSRRALHLAAARHFESMASDELAGVLASHYLAAHRASTAGPEADALAVQARLTLKGAAQRAAALGAHDQAVAYAEQALALPMPTAEQAALLEMAAWSANAAGRYKDAEPHARRALADQRSAGDPTATARAAALLATILIDTGRPGAAVRLLEDELGRLSGDRSASAEVALLDPLSRAQFRNGQPDQCLTTADRALVLAERLDRDDVFGEALLNKAAGLKHVGRDREAMLLNEGMVRLAHEAGEVRTELRARLNLGAILLERDIQRALAVSKESLSLAERLGHRLFAVSLTGQVAYALYCSANDWDEAMRSVEDVVAPDLEPRNRVDLELPIPLMLAARGEPDAGRLAADEAIARGLDDPTLVADVEGIATTVNWCRGDYPAALRAGLRAAGHPDSVAYGLWGALRGALWARDMPGVRSLVERLEDIGAATPAAQDVRAAARGGLAALEGHPGEALAPYEQAIRRWHDMGHELAAASTALDFIRAVGPDVPEARRAAEEARGTFDRVRARVYLERLDSVMAGADDDNAAPLEQRSAGPAASAAPPAS